MHIQLIPTSLSWVWLQAQWSGRNFKQTRSQNDPIQHVPHYAWGWPLSSTAEKKNSSRFNKNVKLFTHQTHAILINTHKYSASNKTQDRETLILSFKNFTADIQFDKYPLFPGRVTSRQTTATLICWLLFTVSIHLFSIAACLMQACGFPDRVLEAIAITQGETQGVHPPITAFTVF